MRNRAVSKRFVKMDTCNTTQWDLPLSVVFTGHVDHGKSSVLGRLLAECEDLAPEKLEKLRLYCQRNGKLFEYAFLTDSLRQERAQGITIDCARIPFRLANRAFQLIDAPGHIEFLKNMVTGAANAQAAFLVIDAAEGIQENSRRHGKMLSLLGLKQVVVLVNKMDTVAYDQAVFESIQHTFAPFLAKVGITARAVIPLSAREGDNFISLSSKMPWYHGPCLREVLLGFESPASLAEQALRFPLQDIYKFSADKSQRRLYVGTLQSGELQTGDTLTFYPSRKQATVKSVEHFPQSRTRATAGEAAAITLTPELFLERGEIATHAESVPLSSGTRVEATLFWLSKEPLTQSKSYQLKLGTASVEARVEEICDVRDASTLRGKDCAIVGQNDIAQIRLHFKQTLAFDLDVRFPESQRFVLVDGYRVAGGGLLTDKLSFAPAELDDQLSQRKMKWIGSGISHSERVKRLKQTPTLLLLTGPQRSGRKALAQSVERALFERGQWPTYLGMGSVVYGLGADLSSEEGNRLEHLRRLGEASHLLLGTGLIVLVSALNITDTEKQWLEKIISPARLTTVWMGSSSPTLTADLRLDGKTSDQVQTVLSYLENEKVIPTYGN